MLLKDQTLCFSGHRPEKLPRGGDISSREVRTLMSKLFVEIENSYIKGYRNFVSGVAKGVDIWAAKYVISMKLTNPEIKLICAVPYRGYGDGWKDGDKSDLTWIFENADEIEYISDEYSKTCMKLRNEYMVDRSSKLIAVISDYHSGTGQTIRYAQKNNLDVSIIDANQIPENV